MADGLFAEFGLGVELLESAPGAERVKLLAQGKGDLLLTATLYHHQALSEEGPLPVRAVASLHQRNPIAALVRADSGIVGPSDLAGRRLGAPAGTQMGWLAAELQAALRSERGVGVGEAHIVDMTYREAYVALGKGEIDLIANFDDLLPIDEARTGTALRAIPLGVDAYTSTVLAADGLPAPVVRRFVEAMGASFERQRAEPERGVAELCTRYPTVDRAVATETWRRLEPYAFTSRGVGSMDWDGWERTIRWASETHGLPSVAVDEVARTDCLTRAGAGPTTGAELRSA